jgi:hypothetical protein
MAKGQQRSNREAKKPKQNKVKATAAASPFPSSKGTQAGATPGKKK